jgi:hypothetical protein
MRWCLASLYYFIRIGNQLGRPPIHQIQITRDRVFRFLLVYFLYERMVARIAVCKFWMTGTMIPVSGVTFTA